MKIKVFVLVCLLISVGTTLQAKPDTRQFLNYVYFPGDAQWQYRIDYDQGKSIPPDSAKLVLLQERLNGIAIRMKERMKSISSKTGNEMQALLLEQLKEFSDPKTIQLAEEIYINTPNDLYIQRILSSLLTGRSYVSVLESFFKEAVQKEQAPSMCSIIKAEQANKSFTNDLVKARTLIQAVIDKTHNSFPSAYFTLGTIAMMELKFNEAIDAYIKAWELKPTDQMAFDNAIAVLGIMWTSKNMQPTEAFLKKVLPKFEKALNKIKSPSPNEYLKISKIAYKANDLIMADRIAAKGLKQFSNDAQLTLATALISAKKGNWKDAELYLNRIFKLSSFDNELKGDVYFLGAVIAFQKNDEKNFNNYLKKLTDIKDSRIDIFERTSEKRQKKL